MNWLTNIWLTNTKIWQSNWGKNMSKFHIIIVLAARHISKIPELG